MKAPLLFIACLSFGWPFSLPAEVAAVHRDKLPQTTTVLAAYDDLNDVERCVERWPDKWRCNIDRNDVVARLGKDLGFLETALKDNKDNRELRLLTLLAAHYAYNVDLAKSYESFQAAYEPLARTQDDDYRPRWFRADFECQLAKPSQGMLDFLQLQKDVPEEKFSAKFWENYTSCAILNMMSTHADYGIAHWRQLKPGDDWLRDQYEKILAERIESYDSGKEYSAKDAWASIKGQQQVTFINRACGISATLKPDWEISQLAFQHGTCALVAATHYYQGTLDKWRPNVMILARPAKPGESLADFEKLMMTRGTYEKAAVEFCPVEKCEQFTGSDPQSYAPGGGARPHIIFIERSEPARPGWLLEEPHDFLEFKPDGGYVTYSPEKQLNRIKGKIFYVVLLDTAVSIEQPADEDFQFFLKNLVIE